jgi:hypothetical protein
MKPVSCDASANAARQDLEPLLVRKSTGLSLQTRRPQRYTVANPSMVIKVRLYSGVTLGPGLRRVPELSRFLRHVT